MKIKLNLIDNNPHRNMRRNPLDPDQVRTVLESIKRNEWGENVIVRPHPTERGRYQLAYGHHRLAALRKLGYDAAEFIVKDVDDWGMYTWMVDENESQRNITPELIYENIEAGITFLEPVIRQCKTADEFNRAVCRNTARIDDQHFQAVRNNLISGEGLGVSFLSETLPGHRSTSRNNIQAVVDIHYANTKAAAKVERAKAKQKEAEAERHREQLARTEHEAKQARARAESLEREAKELREAAHRLRECGVEQKILLSFENARQMTGFAEAVKSNGIPKAKHAELANYLRTCGPDGGPFPGRDFARVISSWWFKASGRAERDRQQAQREAFKRKHRSKSLDEFAAELVNHIREIRKEISAVAEFADSIESLRVRESLSKEAVGLLECAQSLADALRGKPEDPPVINGFAAIGRIA